MPAISANAIAHKVAFVNSSTPSLPIWWSSRTARSGTLSISTFTLESSHPLSLQLAGHSASLQVLANTHPGCDRDRSFILPVRAHPAISLSAK